MFSYIDLVRSETALDAGLRFDITISDEETDHWRTLGDLARTVAKHSGGRVTESEAFDWARKHMAEVYGASAEVTEDSDVFGDYDRVTKWFFARRLGHNIADIPGGSP